MKRPTVRWLMELLGDGWVIVVERFHGAMKSNRHVWAHPQSTGWFVVEVGNALGAASDWEGLQVYVQTHGESLDLLEQQGRLRVVTFAEARRVSRLAGAGRFEPAEDNPPDSFVNRTAEKLLAP